MGIKKSLVLLFGVCLLICGCQQEPSPIIGSWTATEVLQERDSMRLAPEEIRFTFDANGRYRYESTLRYREAGYYRLENGFLIARDTTNGNAEEVVVAVELLKTDSLRLLMRQNGKDRKLLFLKQ